MSLIGALNIGKSALATHQAALAVTSNNVANAGNPDHTRQVARLTVGGDVRTGTGHLVGTGVNLAGVERQIDEALEGRLRSSVADAESAAVRQQWIGRIEAIFNELGDDDLSTRLSAFFGSWSELAGAPQDMGLRQVVVQEGQALASGLRDARSGLMDLRADAEQRTRSLAEQADAMLSEVAELNRRIAISEGGGRGMANALRDQRDAVVRRLSEVLDVKVQDLGNGMVNVLVGSEPLVLGAQSRGLRLDVRPSSDGQTTVAVLTTKDDHAQVLARSGQLGALIAVRAEVDATISRVDALAANVIFEVNKLHASGQGLEGLGTATATYAVIDATAPLNSEAAGLPFKPVNGSLVVHVKQKGTGLVDSVLVKVDLDGQGGDDATLDSLAASLNAISGVSASVTAGRLTVGAESSGVEISFSQDSSGVLAALGINAFFKGSTAADVAVADAIVARPALIAASKNGQPADNQTARAIASLETTALPALSGRTIKDAYESMITGLAASARSAQTSAEAAAAVQETLLAQREALSGVSLDEEAINLMRQQRAYQAAARVVSAVDELMKTLLSI